jgi:S1-C subfamily serine protease
MQARPSTSSARCLPGALLTGTLLLALVSPSIHAAEPQDKAQLRQQLDDARGRLDDAARDVAQLSRQLYGDEVGARHGAGPASPARGAMLGINIGGGTDRAEGVLVTGVSPSGPAEAAGIRTGDVIVAIDGVTLRRADERNAGRQLVEHLRGVPPGQKVKLDYLRDGKKASTAVTTVAAEPPMLRALRERLPMLDGIEFPQDLEHMINPGGRGFRAMELVPVTPKLGQYFGTDKGLLVVKAPSTPGPGLEEGDVILTIGGRTPENPRHAFRILGSYQPQEKVRIEVLRQRKRMTLDVQLPDVGATQLKPRPGVAPPTPPVPPAPAVPPGGRSSIAS